jgi:hypothetical protein
MLFASNSGRASDLIGAIAIAGMGAFFLKYALTGTPALFAHRFKSLR